MTHYFHELFSQNFMPHGHCYFWQPAMVWLQVSSNALIGLSYVAISSTLTYLVYRIKDIPFQKMYLAFGLFIITCGLTHFMDVWTVWNPLYWLDGGIRAVTAIASIGTALLLPPLVPKAVALAQGAKAVHDRGIKLETAYKELEEVFTKTKELDKLKTQFFANVSHELRTPLALILGPTERVLNSAEIPGNLRQDLEVVARNARGLLKQVNDLLDAAKLEAGKMTPHYAEIDISELVRLITSNFETLAHDRNIQFTVSTPDTLPAQLDPEMLQRVILNLLSNAFKFVSDAGKIYFEAVRKNGHVLISIQDNGPGVPEPFREAVFERFRQLDGGDTRRFGGTGLGLAIVKEFVDLMKGKARVLDAPGGGALFQIELPQNAPAGVEVRRMEEIRVNAKEVSAQAIQELRVAPRPEDRVLAQDKGEKGQVLVVEDNPDMNKFVTSTLASHYQVASASDGVDGLEKATLLRPDLIVTDIMMPRMSGDQMVEEIRKKAEFNSVPIILLTARVDEDLKNRLLKKGVQDYVVKPFSTDELLARVKNLITVKRAKDVLEQGAVSQQKNLEALAREVTLRTQELERAVNARDEFLSIASHELKTPLASLKLQLQLTDRKVKPETNEAPAPSEIARCFKMSLKQVDSLTILVDELLDISRIQAGKMNYKFEKLDLASLISDVISRHAEQLKSAKCTVTLDLERGIAGHWDKARIEQVLVNLVANAVKYAPGPIHVNASRTDGNAVIVVKDSGPGIPLEKQAALFERFERGGASQSVGGLGLGLFISRRIVEGHYGAIKLESAPGQGSAFTVELPLNPQDVGNVGLLKAAG